MTACGPGVEAPEATPEVGSVPAYGDPLLLTRLFDTPHHNLNKRKEHLARSKGRIPQKR